MRASEKRKNNILIGVLLGVVVLMGIAYAAFASNLNITGTSSMSENWCIGFDSTRTSDYEATAGISGGTVPTGSMSFSGDSCGGNLKTTASLNASFKQPGDKVEYTLTIGNKGTLAAAIESINVDGDSVTSDTTITKGNIKYIIEMPLSTSLAVNATTTMKVTAMFQNDTDISSSTNEEQTISIAINAVQDDGNGGFTPTPSTFTGTIYRWSTNILFNGLTYNGEATVWYPTTEGYSSAAEAHADNYAYSSQAYCEGDAGSGNCASGTVTLSPGEYETDASQLNKTYYLKHTIVNDIVTASYVCFVTDEEHCMQGGGYDLSTGTSPYYVINKTLLEGQETWFNNHSGSCSFYSGYSYCHGGGFNKVDAHSIGIVHVYGSSSEFCGVFSAGDSRCFQ